MFYAYTCHSAIVQRTGGREPERPPQDYIAIYIHIKRCTAIIGRELSHRQVKKQNNMGLTHGRIPESFQRSRLSATGPVISRTMTSGHCAAWQSVLGKMAMRWQGGREALANACFSIIAYKTRHSKKKRLKGAISSKNNHGLSLLTKYP